MARETIAIIEDGAYRPASAREVRLGESVAAVTGTRLYVPEQQAPGPIPGRDSGPSIEVTNETSLAASRRLGGAVACLVFASAKNPGGSGQIYVWVSGAIAPENPNIFDHAP